MRRYRLVIAALPLLLVARGLHAQTLDKQLQKTLDAGDMDAALRLAAIDESFTRLRIAIEITAAGIDEANVSPTLRPR